MPKEAKSEALRKKREAETDNRCKHCGSKKHSSKDHKPDSRKLNAEEKEERHVEREENEGHEGDEVDDKRGKDRKVK